VGCPTVRESDGLAMSSRNARLGKAERQNAPALHAAMRKAAKSVANGMPAREALAVARTEIIAAGFSAIDYIELRDADTLAAMDRLNRPARLLAAAWLGGVRLIDNIAVDG
ncbi:MAG TPA: pantoate--beta-alanine ligase, partial [Rhizobiaceae bacterium]|nr:pantoate--beta-alanine ligase [Rhizobiaceae bacterium]